MKNQTETKEIVFVTPNLTNNGIARVASELIGEWVKRNYKVIVVQLLPYMFLGSYPMPEGVEYINFNLGTNKYMQMARGVRNLIQVMKRYPNATIISFAYKAIYMVGVASLFTKNRVVLSERDEPYSTPKTKAGRRIRDWAFKHAADVCVFQTSGARDYFPDVVRKKGVIIPNPINPSLPERYEGVREKKIVAAGRLSPQKNFSMLIRAFALLHKDFPEHRLVIYGRGDLEKELRDLAKTIGVGEYVDFPGFSDNIYQDILKCAVYVSSSDYEGISNSMLEALAMGIPSVVTDCPAGGARMVIKNNVNGVLVPVGNEQAMSEGIKKVLSDQAFAESIGKEASKLRDEFPIEKIADRWLEVI